MDGDEEDEVGLEESQLHPLRSLIYRLRQSLTKDQQQEFKLLSTGKLNKNTNIADIKDLSQLTDAIEKNGADVLEFLRSIAQTEFGGQHMDFRGTVRENVEDCIRKIRRGKLKKELSLSVKDEKFVGRIDEMASALRFLQNYSPHITGVYIWGGAGMGKTALADELCHKMKQDTVLVDNLRGKKSVCDLLLSILHALCKTKMIRLLPHQSDEEFLFTENFSYSQDSLTDVIHEKLKSVSKGTILFLDNVDEIEQHNGPDFILALQGFFNIKTDKVKLVMTNRRNLENETNLAWSRDTFLSIQLQPLSKDESNRLLLAYMKDTDVSMQMWEDSQQEAILESCCHCPLVIKTVGKQMTDDLITRLNQLLNEPDLRKDSNPCLQAVFEALPAKSQDRLMLLSVFEAAFDAKMAESVIGEEVPQIGLSELEKQSMIQMHIQECCWSSQGTKNVTYSLHPLVLNCLESARANEPKRYSFPRENAQRQVLEYFSDFVDSKLTDHSFETFAYIDDWKVYLQKLVQFLQVNGIKSLKTPQRRVHFLEIMCKIVSFTSSNEEQMSFLTQVGDELESSYDNDGMLKGFNMMAHRILFLMHQNDTEAATVLLRGLDEKLSQVQDFCVQEFPLKNVALARYYYASGLIKSRETQHCLKTEERADMQEEALDHFNNALEYFQAKKLASSIKNFIRREEATVHNSIGYLYYVQQKYKESYKSYRAAKSCMDEFVHDNYLKDDMHKDIPVYLHNMGTAMWKMADIQRKKRDTQGARICYAEAEDHFKQALKIYKCLGIPDNLTTVEILNGLANVFRTPKKKYVKATNFGKRALRILRRKLQRPNSLLAEALHSLGLIEYSKGGHLRRRAGGKMTADARTAFEKSAVYYRRVVGVLKLGVMEYHESTPPEIRAVHEKVLEILGDTDLEQTKQFYEDFAEDRLVYDPQLAPDQSSSSSSSSEEDFCWVSSDEDEDQEERQSVSKKQDSGFEGDTEEGALGGDVRRAALQKQDNVDERPNQAIISDEMQESGEQHVQQNGFQDDITATCMPDKRARLQKQVSFDREYSERGVDSVSLDKSDVEDVFDMVSPSNHPKFVDGHQGTPGNKGMVTSKRDSALGDSVSDCT